MGANGGPKIKPKRNSQCLYVATNFQIPYNSHHENATFVIFKYISGLKDFEPEKKKNLHKHTTNLSFLLVAPLSADLEKDSIST